MLTLLYQAVAMFAAGTWLGLCICLWRLDPGASPVFQWSAGAGFFVLMVSAVLSSWTLWFKTSNKLHDDRRPSPELDECIQLLARNRGALRFENNEEDAELVNGTVRVGPPRQRRTAHFKFTKARVADAAQLSLIPVCQALIEEGY